VQIANRKSDVNNVSANSTRWVGARSRRITTHMSTF